MALIILAVVIGNFMGALYSSTANVVIPNLIAAFGSDVNTMEWVVTGYMLGFSIAMPLAGWLADTYGRRRMYLIGLAIFGTASICASFSWSASSLIAFRILQAIGGGIVSPTGMAIITDVIPPSSRGKALGLYGMGMMLAPAFGPWISGWIVDNLDDWRPVFLLGVPFGLAAFILSWRILPHGEDRTRAHGAFDLIGFSTLSSSLALFLVPLTQGNRVGWDDPWIGASFVASVLLFAAFVWRELVCASPMLDLSLFRDRIFSVAVVLRGIVGTCYYFAIFLLPLFTQDVLGWTATDSGAVLLPAGLAMALLMPISGTLADRIGARPFVFAGMLIAGFGTFLFSRLDVTWDAARIGLDNAVRTGAIGLLFTPLTAAALAHIPRNRAGSASGILNTIWQVGGSLGIAIGQTYLTNQTAVRQAALAAQVNLSRTRVTSTLSQWAHVAAQHGLPPGTPLAMLSAMVAQSAAVQAYGDTFMLGAILMLVTAPIALLLGGRRRSVL